MDLIKLDIGVFVWYRYPPYRLMVGMSDETREYKFESIEEIEFFIEKLEQLREFVEQTLT